MKRTLSTLTGLLLVIGGLLPILLIAFGLTTMAMNPTLPIGFVIAGSLVSLSILSLGLIVLTSFAHEVYFSESCLEMHFAFRKERVPKECIKWHRNIGFWNRLLGGADVYVIVKYEILSEKATHFRIAILFIEGIGPTVGMSAKDFSTRLDSFMSERSPEA